MPLSGYIVVVRHDGIDGPTCEWCSPKCAIGRDPSCDISISLPSVAPVHCTLELLNNGLVQATSQLDGPYKMFINGTPLNGSCILPNACLLTAGDRQFRFFYPSSRKSVHFDSPGDHLQANVPTAAGDSFVKGHGSPKVATPDSMPKVHPSRKLTPKPGPVTSSRVTPRPLSGTPRPPLGTRERYGPVPPRPTSTPPSVHVLKHTSSASSPNFTPFHPSGLQKHPTPRLSKGAPHKIAQSPRVFSPKSATRVGKPGPAFSGTSPRSPRSALPTPSPLVRSPAPKVLDSRQSPHRARSGVRRSNVRSTSRLSFAAKNHGSDGSGITTVTTGRSSSATTELAASSPVRTPGTKISGYHRAPLGSPPSSLKDKLQANKVSVKGLTEKSVYPNTARVLHAKMKRPMDSRASMVTENIIRSAAKRAKGVSFGPALSPEQFDKTLPPSTPVKKGAIPQEAITPSTSSALLKHRAPTPFSRSVSGVSQKKTPMFSPSYVTATPSRISGVISLPPTPDTNLLDSLNDSLKSSERPISFATYSAPAHKQRSPGRISKPNLRHSFGPEATAWQKVSRKQTVPRVPHSTPISPHRTAMIHSGTSNQDQSTGFARTSAQFSGKSRPPGAKVTSPRRGLVHPRLSSTHPRKSPLLFSPLSANQVLEKDPAGVLSLDSPRRSVGRPRASSVPLEDSTGCVTPTITSRVWKNSKSGTPPVSGVAHLSSPADRNVGRPRSSSILSAAKSSAPHNAKRMDATTPQLTGAHRLMEIPRSPTTPRIPTVADLLQSSNASSATRRPRASSAKSSASSTPRSTKRTVSKTPLTGVRRLMKTPKSSATPRVSGVAEMFQTTDVNLVSPHRSVGRPRASSAKSSASSTPRSTKRTVSKTPLTGVRRLMKTPKSSATPRVSGVAEMFQTTDVNLVSPHRSVGRPRASSAKSSASSTPRSTKRTVSKTPLTGVRRLMKTPKSSATPRVSGVAEMFQTTDVNLVSPHRSVGRPRASSAKSSASSTPRSTKRTVSKTPLTGVRRLMKTPKSSATPRVSGVAEMFQTTDVNLVSPHRSVGRPRASSAKSSVSSTPRSTKRTVSKTPLTGVRRLMKTPKSSATPRVSGVAEMFQTTDVNLVSPHRSVGRPRASSAKSSASSTPRSTKRTVSKTPLTGVRRLMKTPKSSATPRVSGVAEMFQTTDVNLVSPHRSVGRPRASSAKSSASSTPRSTKRTVSKTPLTGVRRLMKTPKSSATPRVSGVAEVFQTTDVNLVSPHRSVGRPRASSAKSSASSTPRSTKRTVSKTPLTGVRRLMKTPKSSATPRVSGVAEVFQTTDVNLVSPHRSVGRPRASSSTAGKSSLKDSVIAAVPAGVVRTRRRQVGVNRRSFSVRDEILTVSKDPRTRSGRGTLANLKIPKSVGKSKTVIGKYESSFSPKEPKSVRASNNEISSVITDRCSSTLPSSLVSVRGNRRRGKVTEVSGFVEVQSPVRKKRNLRGGVQSSRSVSKSVLKDTPEITGAKPTITKQTRSRVQLGTKSVESKGTKLSSPARSKRIIQPGRLVVAKVSTPPSESKLGVLATGTKRRQLHASPHSPVNSKDASTVRPPSTKRRAVTAVIDKKESPHPVSANASSKSSKVLPEKVFVTPRKLRGGKKRNADKVYLQRAVTSPKIQSPLPAVPSKRVRTNQSSTRTAASVPVQEPMQRTEASTRRKKPISQTANNNPRLSGPTLRRGRRGASGVQSVKRELSISPRKTRTTLRRRV
ncbi:hypothetical protein CSKR_101412 [Clonorchis sinensis]|uniref:FHA domain-containing protein n=1 Tax=Clonorchis sinensis TaxID=79923 RepID=A0A8T1MPN6_CLOSI|nr:hypothetical protein CSKR_101412 [Clonorchis sinensis]